MEKDGKRKRRKFTDQYKAETVRLIERSGKSIGLKVYSHWFKNVETDPVDRLAKSLTTGSKNLGHFLDTSEVAPKANTA